MRVRRAAADRAARAACARWDETKKLLVAESLLGSDHPAVAHAEQEVAETLAALDDRQEAARHAGQALAIWKNCEYVAPETLHRAEELAR